MYYSDVYRVSKRESTREQSPQWCSFHISFLLALLSRTARRHAGEERKVCVESGHRRLKPEKPTNTCPLAAADEQSKFQRANCRPLAWLCSAKEIRFWERVCFFWFFNFEFFFLSLKTALITQSHIAITTLHMPFLPRVLRLDFYSGKKQYNILHDRQVASFGLKIGRALNRSLFYRVNTLHPVVVFSLRSTRKREGSANKIFLAHGDANTVSRDDV